MKKWGTLKLVVVLLIATTLFMEIPNGSEQWNVGSFIVFAVLELIIFYIFIILLVRLIRRAFLSKRKHSETDDHKHRSHGVSTDRSDKQYGIHCFVREYNHVNYTIVLNQLQHVVEDIVRQCPNRPIDALVMVHKLDNTYCSVFLQIEDLSFSIYHITFGDEFIVDDDMARFETELATNFTTPEAVKREILLQFNWYDIVLSKQELTVLDQGDYKNTPLIVFRFSATYNN